MGISSIEHVDLTNEQEERTSAGGHRVQIREPAPDNESFKFPTEVSHGEDMKQMRMTQRLPRLGRIKKPRLQGTSDSPSQGGDGELANR